jgi:predicted Zn finger-like uncharacterized protein
MDVRCEKCHTEYELEDAKVTEAGVTVKCTSCGNLFKIKRRSAAAARPLDSPADGGGMWVIRSPGGEVRRFKELTTLQQWIVERKVTRECEISRSGETWKRLGDIAELSAFFAIVDQVGGVRPQASPTPVPSAEVERKGTQPLAPPTVAPAKPPSVPVPALSAPAVLAAERRPELAATAQLPPPARKEADARPARSSWAGNAVAEPALNDISADDSFIRRANEPAFTRNDQKMKDIPLPSQHVDAPSFEIDAEQAAKHARTVKVAPGSLGDFSGYDDYVPRQKSKAWIFVVAITVAGGVTLFYLATRGKSSEQQQPAALASPTAPTVTPGAAPAPAAAPDAGAKAAPDPAATAYREGLAKLQEDTDEAFAAAEKSLEAAHVAEVAQDARVSAGLALVSSTLAQYLADDAANASDPKAADQLRAESARRLTKAEKLAKDAEAKAPQSPEALIAAADVMRLGRKPAADVEKKLGAAADTPEGLYVRGMLRWRDGKTAEAEELLTQAIAARAKDGGELLRAHYRLAVIAVAAGKKDAAKTHIDAILAAQPAHARAKALRDKLAAPVAAATPPPATPAAPTTPAEPPKPGEKTPLPAATTADLGTGPLPSSAYTGLVGKGDKLAENGDCATAMKYYDRALDARPGGVEALTGLGYCYLDGKQYERAISSFRAALGISSRYQEALIGIAEAYRFQGMQQEALTYYKRYLDQAPNGPKANMAKHYIESMGPKEQPAAPPTAPAASPEATPVDKLPDKAGAAEPAPATPPQKPPAAEPSEPAAPPIDKLPDKPDQPKSEPAPEPPPPAPQQNPAAPDSPKSE